MDAAAEIAGETRPVTVPTGVAVAALLAGVLGLLVLGIVNIWSDVDSGVKTAITLNAGIGPYSGKELLMIVSWLVSWVVLHFALRNKQLNVRKWFAVVMALLLVAVLLVWPP